MGRVNDMMSILKGTLKLTLPSTIVMTEGVVSGDPVLTINDGSAATGEDNAYIKIKQKAYAGFPQSSLANATNKDGQASVCQLVVEESAVTGESLASVLFMARLVSAITALNVDLEVYLSDTTVVPVEAQITEANLQGVIRANARIPNAGM